MCRDLYPSIEEKCLFSVRAKMLLFLHFYGYGFLDNNSNNNFTLGTCVHGFGYFIPFWKRDLLQLRFCSIVQAVDYIIVVYEQIGGINCLCYNLCQNKYLGIFKISMIEIGDIQIFYGTALLFLL